MSFWRGTPSVWATAGWLRGIKTFHALDGLRGAAAIAVLMAHAAALFRPVWVRSAYLAVDLFFVLSGFVLAHAYGARLRSGLSAAGFMRIRLIRVMPLYLLGTAIAIADALVQRGLGHTAWGGAALLRSSLAALALVPLPPAPGTPDNFVFPLNVPAWSLLFEFLVNALYAVLAPTLTPRRVAALTGAALLALAITDWRMGSLAGGADWPTLWVGLPRVVFSFFAGVLTYHLAGYIGGRRRFNPWLFLPALMLLFYMPVPAGLRWLFDLGCAGLLFPGLILFAATAELRGQRQQAACSLLGGISFALYTIHVPMLNVAESLLSDHDVGPAWRAPYTGALFLLVVIGSSIAADRLFDRPLQRWLRSHTGRQAPRPVAPIAPPEPGS